MQIPTHIATATRLPNTWIVWTGNPPAHKSVAEHRLSIVEDLVLASRLATPVEPGSYPLWMRTNTKGLGLLVALPSFTSLDMHPERCIRTVKPLVPFREVGEVINHRVYFDATVSPLEIHIGVGNIYTVVQLTELGWFERIGHDRHTSVYFEGEG